MLRGIVRRLRPPTAPSLLRSQEGSVIIMVAVMIVALFSFAVIAIDGSIMQTTKTELQNGADAAALAGAFEYARRGGDVQAAKEAAVKFAGYNNAVRDIHEPIVISPDDVEVNTEENYVKVETFRTAAHQDPLRTYFLKIFSLARLNQVDVHAVAWAEINSVCEVQCVKPWAIPDRWDDENNNNAYDYGEFYDPDLTGYNAPGDLGTLLEIKVGQPQDAFAPGQYFPVDLPPMHDPVTDPIPGGDAYREWIATCAPYFVGPGDSLKTEPGNMVGPTTQGMADLIAQDPGAYWDPVTKSVQGSAYGQSPRVVLVPFFIPASHQGSGKNYVIVSKVGAFFLDHVTAKGVQGYFMKVAAQGNPCDDPDQASFFVGLRLIDDPANSN